MEAGEYYHVDLIGLPCLSEDGEPLGKVVAIENFGAGDVIEIERTSPDALAGKRFMVPMRPKPCRTGMTSGLVVSAAFVEA